MLLPHVASTIQEPRLPTDGPPRSIIIIGSGVFGLTTAYSLSHRPAFKDATITVIDKSPFPAADGSSIDSSRIIRADYSDDAYARLAAEALNIWRQPEPAGDDSSSDNYSGSENTRSIYTGVGDGGRYSQSGFVLVADEEVDYINKSYVNVLKQGGDDNGVRFLKDETEIKAVMGTGGVTGRQGYINPMSGWANAEEAMKWVRRKCEQRDNIKFLEGEVKTLWVSGNGREGTSRRVEGVILGSGDMMSAELTVLAAGAWSAGLVDLTGRAISTGQVMAYLDVSDEEEERLKGIPVAMNFTDGVFYFPPKNRVLKIARHSFGYVNSMKIEGFEDGTKELLISRPITSLSNPGLVIPAEASDALRKGLAKMLPELATRDWANTRLCWYTDTPTGDFIVDYHPNMDGLFLATGGSGHAFKFLPVLGERISDRIEGQLTEELLERWRIRSTIEGHIATMDGSRNGVVRAELRDLLNI